MTGITFRPAPVPDGFEWHVKVDWLHGFVTVKLRHCEWWRWPRTVDKEVGWLTTPIANESAVEEIKRLTRILRGRCDARANA